MHISGINPQKDISRKAVNQAACQATLKEIYLQRGRARMKRVGSILGVEFENKSNWLAVRAEAIETTRGGDLDDE